MSKMDGLRALREARYEQRTAGATKPAAKRPAAARKTSPRAAEPEVSDVELCGHRSMNGRTCTREQGHAAKSHRYA
jgi:hypothetical protein